MTDQPQPAAEENPEPTGAMGPFATVAESELYFALGSLLDANAHRCDCRDICNAPCQWCFARGAYDGAVQMINKRRRAN